MKLAGAAAIVTGGGSGLGKATAEAFAAKGARVAVLDRNAEAAAAVAAAIGGLALAGDVADFRLGRSGPRERGGGARAGAHPRQLRRHRRRQARRRPRRRRSRSPISRR